MRKALTIIAAILIMCSCSPKTKLVTYFSATGTTKAVAERLAAITDADLFEIAPAELYTDADLDWHDSLSRSSVEMKDAMARPEMAKMPRSLKKYDTIYIGFPIWWYTAPRIIKTFIESNDLAGKKLVIFATSGSSSPKGALKDMLQDYPELDWVGAMLLNDVTDGEIEALVCKSSGVPCKDEGHCQEACKAHKNYYSAKQMKLSGSISSQAQTVE